MSAEREWDDLHAGADVVLAVAVRQPPADGVQFTASAHRPIVLVELADVGTGRARLADGHEITAVAISNASMVYPCAGECSASQHSAQ